MCVCFFTTWDLQRRVGNNVIGGQGGVMLIYVQDSECEIINWHAFNRTRRKKWKIIKWSKNRTTLWLSRVEWNMTITHVGTCLFVFCFVFFCWFQDKFTKMTQTRQRCTSGVDFNSTHLYTSTNTSIFFNLIFFLDF